MLIAVATLASVALVLGPLVMLLTAAFRGPQDVLPFEEGARWTFDNLTAIYLDAGLYNGLDETLNERIILHRRHSYELPVDLTSAISSLFIRGRLHRQRRLGPPRSAINSR